VSTLTIDCRTDNWITVIYRRDLDPEALRVISMLTIISLLPYAMLDQRLGKMSYERSVSGSLLMHDHDLSPISSAERANPAPRDD